ncbi:MAG TPA: T9SS type A sorting domain-containing protein [Chitinophagaceae bacterium]|jgi:hypothetical protein
MKTVITQILRQHAAKAKFLLSTGFVFIQLCAFSQQQVAKTIPYPASPEGLIGFLQFTPSDYGSQKHPLIIFMHGIGERGNGTTDIQNITDNGIPNLTAHGASMRFTVAGKTSSFVVLSPQLSTYYGSWPTFYVQQMIQYAKANLSIDTDRIYVTGLSLGGGGCWTYAFDSIKNDLAIAALAPVCGTDYGNDPNACATAGTSHLPIWAFHCEDDGTVPVGNLQHVMLTLNIGCGGYTPAPRYTYYLTGGHSGAWINAYDTGHITRAVDSSQVKSGASTNVNFKATPNLYEWLLSNKRATPVAVVNAPSMVTTTSTSFDASASYSPNGAITNYNWTQTAGPTTASIANGVATPVVSNLASGSYTFSLAITDVLGATASTTTTLSVAAALPVTWVYFKGQRNGGSNLLQWETASEQNTDYFSVERSSDGINYTSIGKLSAAGNSNTAKDYSFTDGNPVNGNSYYRLRQVDKDAQSKLSEVVLISGSTVKTIEQMYPNPVRDQLNVVLDNAAIGSGRIVVYDLTGRTLQQETIAKTQQVYSSSLNMKNLVPGLYIVEVKVGDSYKIMQRVLKQ